MLDDRIFKVLAGFVLALSLAACGGGGGGGGNGGGSVATGWIVAFRETPGSEAASVYRAGSLPGGTPVVTVAGARRIENDPNVDTNYNYFEPKELIDAGLTLYRVPEATHPTAPLGDGAIGLFRAGAPVTLAAPMTNHYYRYAGFQPGTPTGRILVRDAFSADGGTTATAHSLLSFDVAGGGMRTLATNCTSDPAGYAALVASAEGVLFKCDGTANLAFSDGVAAAIMDMPSMPGSTPRPLAVVGGRAISFDGVKYVTTQLLDGSGNAARLAPSGDFDTPLGAISGTRLLVLTFTTATGKYQTYSVSVDGSNSNLVCGTSTQNQLFRGTSPDGSKYLLAINDTKKRLCAGDYAYAVSPVYTPDLTPGFNAVSGWWYADGKVLVQPAAGSGAHYSTVGADGTGLVDLGEPETSLEWGVYGDRAIIQQQGPAYELRSIKEDGSSFATLTPNFRDEISFQLVPSVGRLTFTDDANVPWIATPDGSFKAQLDSGNASLVRFTGNSGPGNGNRDYYVITRPAAPSQFDTVSWDVQAHTASTILGGPTSDYGVWVPN